MSTTAFTQANGQNLMKWEVAGANKKTKKQSDQNDRSPSYKHFKLLNNQMPRIEPMREHFFFIGSLGFMCVQMFKK
jgi:hypothetical protein